jgi:hypothetical protein
MNTCVFMIFNTPVSPDISRQFEVSTDTNGATLYLWRKHAFPDVFIYIVTIISTPLLLLLYSFPVALFFSN